jgi:hypothetical protein
LSSAKCGIVGERLNGKELLRVQLLVQLLININGNVALQKIRDGIATFLPIAAEQFCLASYWLIASFPEFLHTQPIGIFAQRVSVLCGHFPAAYQYPSRIDQRQSNSL